MTSIDLQEACRNFKGGSQGEFGLLVAGAQALGLSQRDLAREFEVAESTVSRWARGIARPHPLIQKQIVQAIARKSRRAEAAAPVQRPLPMKAVG